MYFHLTSKLNLDDFIDIRDGDVKTFIDNHRNSTLEWAITKAILAQNKDKNPDDLIHVESHVILDKTEQSATPKLGSKKHSGTVTVYMNVLELSYSTYGGELKEVGGSSIPTVITFKVDEYGNYTIEEYWIPRDGSYYASDIDKKFTDIAKEALRKLEDSGDDIQQNECLKKAQSRLMLIGTIDKKIAGLLETVCSSPATSSNPGDYIAAHKAEYDELVSHGENTLRYCFSEFLKGGQTDLRGHIMALVCQDIAENAGEAFTIDGYLSTGQDWFDAFLKNAEDMQKRIPAEDLEKLYPVSYLLLQISSRPLCTYCYETAGTYRFDGGGDILKSASVKLDENGEFIMTFSPVSSYIGHGKYSVDNDRLTLKTDDGWFTYAFHVGLGENGTILIFNAAASSDNVWYSGITNGSVFRQ